MDEEPIFDFLPLRDFLTRKGYIVAKAQGYKPFKPEVVDPMEEIRRGTMEFRDDGIFVINPENGEEQQIFLYKYDYHLTLYGKPRFHICRCDTINQMIRANHFNGHYVRANTDPVPVQNMDNGYEEVMVSNLQLCKYCIDKINQYGNINSEEFVQILSEINNTNDVDENIEIEVDIFGYTRDWEQISKNFREEHLFTCNRCGLRIDDLFDRQYIHCHHKDGNKLNNNSSNLECLCIECHSQVDDRHRKNFSLGANGIMLADFRKKYR